MPFNIRSGMEVIGPGDYCTIRPPVGEAWTIQNIYTPEIASLYITDGTYDIMIAEMDNDAPASMGFLGGFCFELVNDHYLEVSNDDDESHPIGYGGKWALNADDVVHELRSLAIGETMEIQPDSGGYIIQNIYLEGTGNVEFTNGVYTSLINRNNTTTALLCGNYECSTTEYLQITNISAGEALFGFDGFKI